MSSSDYPIQQVHITNAEEVSSGGKRLPHECQNMELLTEMRIDIAEMSRDFVHLASCVQELTAQLTEFMQTQDERISQITNTCVTRSVKWGEVTNDINDIKQNQRDIYKRVEAIEKVHEKDEGATQGTKPYKDYFIYILMTVTTIIITYVFAKGGISTN